MEYALVRPGIFLIILLLPVATAYAQEPSVLEQITPNGLIKVQVLWPEVRPDELYQIEVRFLNPETNELMDDATITFDFDVVQAGLTVENYPEQRTSTGASSFGVEFDHGATGSAEVIIIIRSVGDGADSVQMHEKVSFNVNVVPEFPALLVAIAAAFAVPIMLAKRHAFDFT